jgi:hypothetical protein
VYIVLYSWREREQNWGGGREQNYTTVSSTKPCLFILHGKVINALTIIEEKHYFILYVYTWRFLMCYLVTEPTPHTVKPVHAVTSIKRSTFSCPIIENSIWIEPLLRGHLSYKISIFCPRGDPLTQAWLWITINYYPPVPNNIVNLQPILATFFT